MYMSSKRKNKQEIAVPAYSKFIRYYLIDKTQKYELLANFKMPFRVLLAEYGL